MNEINERTHNAFLTALRKTFSEMAFIDVIERTKPDEPLESSQVLYLTFSEPERGYVALYLPRNCKKTIVENIYSSDWDELQSSEIDDCLLELLNVLVGNYLIEVYGEEAKRDMSLPQMLFDDLKLEDDSEHWDLYFNAEEEIFRCVLKVEKSG